VSTVADEWTAPDVAEWTAAGVSTAAGEWTVADESTVAGVSTVVSVVETTGCSDM